MAKIIYRKPLVLLALLTVLLASYCVQQLTQATARSYEAPKNLTRGHVPVTGKGLSRIVVKDLGFRLVKRSFHGVHVFTTTKSGLGFRSLNDLERYLQSHNHTDYRAFANALKPMRNGLKRAVQSGRREANDSIAAALADKKVFAVNESALADKGVIAIPTDVLKESGYLYLGKNLPLKYFTGVDQGLANRLALQELARRGTAIPINWVDLLKVVDSAGFKVETLKARSIGRFKCPKVTVLLSKSASYNRLRCLDDNLFEEFADMEVVNKGDLRDLTDYLKLTERDTRKAFFSDFPAYALMVKANKGKEAFVSSEQLVKGKHALPYITVIGVGIEEGILAFKTGSAASRGNKSVDSNLLKAVIDRTDNGSIESFNKRVMKAAKI